MYASSYLEVIGTGGTLHLVGAGAVPMTRCGSIQEDPQSIKEQDYWAASYMVWRESRSPIIVVLRTGGDSEPRPSELGHLGFQGEGSWVEPKERWTSLFCPPDC